MGAKESTQWIQRSLSDESLIPTIKDCIKQLIRGEPGVLITAWNRSAGR